MQSPAKRLQVLCESASVLVNSTILGHCLVLKPDKRMVLPKKCLRFISCLPKGIMRFYKSFQQLKFESDFF